jgi:hypothetical protein
VRFLSVPCTFDMLTAAVPAGHWRMHAMTVYAIALLNIADREPYGAYERGAKRSEGSPPAKRAR